MNISIKEKEPLISIIVPVYNCEKYISKCIESILSQTFYDFELILINDGSTDKSLNICMAFADKNQNIVVIDKKNEGVSVTRNKGIETSRGRYITFIDSDDWIEPTYLEDFKIQTVDADLYSQGIRYFISHKNIYYTMFKYQSKKISIINNPHILLKYRLLENGCPVAKLYKREIIIKNSLRFNPSLSINEDHLFVTEYITKIDTIFLIDSINYNYLIDYKQISLTKKSRTASDFLNVAKILNDSFNRLCKRYKENDLIWLPAYYSYGPNQVLRAITSTILDNNFESFIECIKDWNKYKLTKNYIVNTTSINKLVSKILNTKFSMKFQYKLCAILIKSNLKIYKIKRFIKSKLY